MSGVMVAYIAVLLGAVAVIGQHAPADAGVNTFGTDLVFAKAGDGLPKRIEAKGTIVDANPHGRDCGGMTTGGTLKIKLKEQPSRYPHDFLYVAVLCFVEDREDFLGKVVELNVKKITRHPYSFGVSWATLNSEGAPFYLADVDGIGGLLKKITLKPRGR